MSIAGSVTTPALLASSRASSQQMSYFWILPFSRDHCYEEWPPLPHSPCLLFPTQRVPWLLHESIIPWRRGPTVMFSLALEPELWLASTGRCRWTWKSLYFSHVKAMAKLHKSQEIQTADWQVVLGLPWHSWARDGSTPRMGHCSPLQGRCFTAQCAEGGRAATNP